MYIEGNAWIYVCTYAQAMLGMKKMSLVASFAMYPVSGATQLDEFGSNWSAIGA